jgi:hypothetical protein
MKKLLSVITILLLSQNVFSQNKKEQIEILTKSLDSINTALIKERNDFSVFKTEYEQTIYRTKLDLESKNSKIIALSKQLDSNYLIINELNAQLSKSNIEISSLQSKFQNAQETIIKTQNEISNYKSQITAKNKEVDLVVPSNRLDSLYKIDFKSKKIDVHEITFRDCDSNIYAGGRWWQEGNIDIRPIDFNVEIGNNAMINNRFLFVAFNAKEFKQKYVSIKITIQNTGKTVTIKDYFWAPSLDGNYYIWLDLNDKNYFTCFQKSNIQIKVIDDKTKQIIFTNNIKYDVYCDGE